MENCVHFVFYVIRSVQKCLDRRLFLVLIRAPGAEARGPGPRHRGPGPRSHDLVSLGNRKFVPAGLKPGGGAACSAAAAFPVALADRPDVANASEPTAG